MTELVLLLSQGTQSVDIEVDAWALVTFIAYLLIIIGIGIYSARFSSKGLAHYFIGGREINRLVVALSSVVSGRSAWLLLGFTGMAYVQGASAVWAALGYTIVEFLLLFFYAPRIRSFTEAYDCITLPDFFAARFNDKLINKGQATSQKTLVMYSRIVVVALVILALLMAFFFQELVFWLVLFAWAGVGAAIGPISILALFWRRTTWAGAIAGMLTGTAVTLIWYNVPVLKDSLYELIPAFIGSIIVTVVVSRFTEQPKNTGEMFSFMEGAKANDIGPD